MSAERMDVHSPSSADAADRRDPDIVRVAYEALVEVGAGSTGGFEAESVDISPDGMRLRTAYMPSPGEVVVCRFDGFGGEVVAEGEVSWCRHEQRGGEFGLRFTHLDEHGAALLGRMCGPASGAGAPDQPVATDDQAALPGSRVRLHIHGLGSPMRARVRDVASGEVLIGSNLEFLRVGRDVELEDVEQGRKRVAFIEHVSVDIDHESSIPQLVVALRYEDMPVDELESTTSPYRVAVGPHPSPQPEPLAAAEAESTPEPAVIDSSGRSREPAPEAYQGPGGDQWRSFRAAPRGESYTDEPSEPPPDTTPSTLHTPVQMASDNGDELRQTAIAKQKVGELARKIGPKLASAGAGARGAFGRLISSVQKKRAARAAEREELAKAKAPKRTTAPPPSGALRSDGRRLVREPSEPPEVAPLSSAPAPKRTDKKRAVVGAIVGIAAVLGIYATSNALSKQTDPAPPLAATAAAAPPGLSTALPPAPGGGIATAKVPLFGATPLSTTEPVPVPPGLAGSGAAAEPEAADDKAEEDKPLQLDKEWGAGEVKNPTVLRIKIDDPIANIAGTESATSFTLVIPKRKSVSPTSRLTRKDKRLDSLNVVNYPDRAEVTVSFKGDVPPFLAKSQGQRLIIEIGNEKKGKKKPTKSSTSQRRSKIRSKKR